MEGLLLVVKSRLAILHLGSDSTEIDFVLLECALYVVNFELGRLDLGGIEAINITATTRTDANMPRIAITIMISKSVMPFSPARTRRANLLLVACRSMKRLLFLESNYCTNSFI